MLSERNQSPNKEMDSSTRNSKPAQIISSGEFLIVIASGEKEGLPATGNKRGFKVVENYHILTWVMATHMYVLSKLIKLHI